MASKTKNTKEENDFERSVMDEVIKRDHWKTMYESARDRAMNGDQRAFEFLVKRRFGEVVQEHDGGMELIIKYTDAKKP